MFGEILVEILHVVMIELITKVHPADLSDFPFVCRRFLAVSSRKYSILILVIHEVAVPPFRYVKIVR